VIVKSSKLIFNVFRNLQTDIFAILIVSHIKAAGCTPVPLRAWLCSGLFEQIVCVSLCHSF